MAEGGPDEDRAVAAIRVQPPPVLATLSASATNLEAGDGGADYEGADNRSKSKAGGDVHDGQWKGDEREGRGVTDGDVPTGGRSADTSPRGEYEGERNKIGEREGHGTMHYACGDVYEGEWKSGKIEGFGKMCHSSGDVYEGEYKSNKREGRGTYYRADGAVFEGEFRSDEREGCGTMRYASGTVDVTRCCADCPVGQAARWSADGQTAWRLRNGKVVERISLEAAAEIARRLGLEVPAAVAIPPPVISKGGFSFRRLPRRAAPRVSTRRALRAPL